MIIKTAEDDGIFASALDRAGVGELHRAEGLEGHAGCAGDQTRVVYNRRVDIEINAAIYRARIGYVGRSPGGILIPDD